MKKLLMAVVITMLMLFSVTTVMADVNPVTYQSTITVGEDGGRYQVGFVNVEFKKEFMDLALLPATFDAEIYAENGQVYIEFAPDTPLFFKKVHLRIDSYEGYIYDRATKENIYVTIEKHQLHAEHFSRYALNF